MDELECELSRIVGLGDLKLQLRKWTKGMLLDERRRAISVKFTTKKQPHMAFLGNPGTGKTTIARILGKILHSLGILSRGQVIEVQRTDLVGEYIGQTGPKTRIKIEEAIGGILFVDEAYRLAPTHNGKNNDLGVEALEEIMSSMENKNLVVIFAGYPDPMKRLFALNSGLLRRVPHIFEFGDFTCSELAEMTILKMSNPREDSAFCGFNLHSECTCKDISETIEKHCVVSVMNQMNGGLIDQMLIKAKENLDSRLSLEAADEEMFTITLQDLEVGLKLLNSSSVQNLQS